MDDALLMRGVECPGDLARNLERIADRQRPLPQTIGERDPLDQFKHQRADAVGILQSIDRADMRMIERRKQARFAGKPRAALGVRRELRWKDLDRDLALELAVPRAIDLPHAPGAERREDRVRSELTPHHLHAAWPASEGACQHDRRRCFQEPH